MFEDLRDALRWISTPATILPDARLVIPEPPVPPMEAWIDPTDAELDARDAAEFESITQGF